MEEERRIYISYLLRIWRVERGGKLVWLASLESPKTDERRGFLDLEALFDFLRAQAEACNQNQ